jgi:hypothetical protein
MANVPRPLKLWATASAAPSGLIRIRVEMIYVTTDDGETIVSREYLVSGEHWRLDLLRQLTYDLEQVQLPEFDAIDLR